MTEFTEAQTIDFTDPESVLRGLFKAGGGTQAGLRVAEELIVSGHDPITEARSAAKRGTLGAAMEYIQAASVPLEEKIRVAEEVATTVSRYFADKEISSPIDGVLAQNAVAVMQGSMRFFQSQNQS